MLAVDSRSEDPRAPRCKLPERSFAQQKRSRRLFHVRRNGCASICKFSRSSLSDSRMQVRLYILVDIGRITQKTALFSEVPSQRGLGFFSGWPLPDLEGQLAGRRGLAGMHCSSSRIAKIISGALKHIINRGTRFEATLPGTVTCLVSRRLFRVAGGCLGMV